jgi:hypothetical protein
LCICLLRKHFLNRTGFVVTWLKFKFIRPVSVYMLSKTVSEIQHIIDTNNILFNCCKICLRVQ